LADQAASSASNFILALSVLATASSRQFATFSVAVTGYLLVTQLTRSVFSLPVLILYSADEGDPAARAGAAVAAAVATGVAGAVVFAGVGLGFERGRALFLVLAVALPFLQYQDAVRHVAVAAARPRVAAESDLAWVALQVVGTVVVAAAGRGSPAALVAVWAGAGSLSGVVFGARLGAVPRFSQCRGWLEHNRRLCLRLGAEFVLNSGSYYALSYGLVAVAGVDELGRWRAAQTLIGPVSVLLLGGTTLGVPESVRVRERNASLWRTAALLSTGLAAVAVAGGALAYALLPALGPSLFPETWQTARPVLPVLTLFAAAVGASTGPIAALRAGGHAGWIVAARAVSGGSGLVLGIALASRSGAVGALVGLTLSEAGFALAAWLRLRRAVATPALAP
jgi:O-antigen/teichoic acid export membrane protein